MGSIKVWHHSQLYTGYCNHCGTESKRIIQKNGICVKCDRLERKLKLQAEQDEVFREEVPNLMDKVISQYPTKNQGKARFHIISLVNLMMDQKIDNGKIIKELKSLIPETINND